MSSVSPTHGDQEGTAYNGHFGCSCYYPLFVFNQFGDLERSSLRPGNVHSADGWRGILEPVIERYRERDLRRYFRGDAAFASPDIYEFLEAEAYTYAVRLQLHALAYNLGNFMRTLALLKEVEHWSLTTLREKLLKIGAKVVSHGRYVTFQLAEVAVSRNLFQNIIALIDCLRPRPAPA